MDCKRATELMPWYLNGTLEAAELGELDEHLAACERCREELEETRAALVLFGGHPTPAMLVDYAFEREGSARDVIAAHLSGCQACAEELALARASRRELDREAAQGPPAKVVPLRRPAAPGPTWRAAAVAAALVGLVGVAGGLSSWRTLERREAEFADRERAAERQIAELEAELRGAAGARLNVPIYDLWPAGDSLRSPGDGPKRLAASDGPLAVLILNSLPEPGRALDRLELRGADGELLQSLSGLEEDGTGAITLSVPLDRLPRGTLRILLFAEDAPEPLETYTFELR